MTRFGLLPLNATNVRTQSDALFSLICVCLVLETRVTLWETQKEAVGFSFGGRVCTSLDQGIRRRGLLAVLWFDMGGCESDKNNALVGEVGERVEGPPRGAGGVARGTPQELAWRTTIDRVGIPFLGRRCQTVFGLAALVQYSSPLIRLPVPSGTLPGFRQGSNRLRCSGNWVLIHLSKPQNTNNELRVAPPSRHSLEVFFSNSGRIRTAVNAAGTLRECRKNKVRMRTNTKSHQEVCVLCVRNNYCPDPVFKT